MSSGDSRNWRVGWYGADTDMTYCYFATSDLAEVALERVTRLSPQLPKFTGFREVPVTPKDIWLHCLDVDSGYWVPVKGPDMSFLDEYVTRSEFTTFQQTVQEQLSQMATQADVDALTNAVNQIAADLATEQTDLATATTNLQTEINNLAAANPSVNVTALQAALSPLDATVTNLQNATNALNSLAPQTPPPTT